MHKRLATDLMSLAHEILTMKSKDNVFALKEKAAELHEKLAVLAFVEEYVATTPKLETPKEFLSETVKSAISQKEMGIETNAENKEIEQKEVVEEKTKEVIKVEPLVQEIIEQPFEELEEIIFSKLPEENTEEAPKIEEPILKSDLEVSLDKETVIEHNKEVTKPKIVQTTLEEELKDTIAVDVAASLFDVPVQKSLNDKLVASINIGLNDRIAFVKHLFNGSQEDYNRVVSQLNTFKTEKEAKKFINKMVKPDYDWSSQEELESRFISIIEKKFI